MMAATESVSGQRFSSKYKSSRKWIKGEREWMDMSMQGMSKGLSSAIRIENSFSSFMIFNFFCRDAYRSIVRMIDYVADALASSNLRIMHENLPSQFFTRRNT